MESEKRLSYVYRHKKAGTNEVFYIGIGVKKSYGRAYTKSGRNKHWENLVNKYGFEVEIIADKLTREEARELEIMLIEHYGRFDLGTGKLVNMTAGGDGMSEPTPEIRKALSERSKGENNPMYGVEVSQYRIDCIKKANTGRIVSEETKELWKKTRPRGENHPNWGKRGELSPRYGAIFTQEHKDKISKAIKGRVLYSSPCDNPQSIKVINIVTLSTYCCIKEAEGKEGISKNLLSKYLRKELFNPTNLMLLSDYESGIRNIPQPEENKRQVKLIDTVTLIIYNSIKEGAEACGVPFNTLRKYLKGEYKNKTNLIYLKDYKED